MIQSHTGTSPLTSTPWKLAGFTKSTWLRLVRKGLAPRPVRLPTLISQWRVSDVMEWIQALPLKTENRPARAGAGRPRKNPPPAVAEEVAGAS